MKNNRRKMKSEILTRITALIIILTLLVTSGNVNILAQSVNQKSENKKITIEAEKKENVENKESKNDSEQSKKQSDNKKEEEPNVVKEIKKLRTEKSSTYLLSDGSKKLEIYGMKIRYKEKGKYINYAPSLKKVSQPEKDKFEEAILKSKILKKQYIDEYAYVNMAGDSKQYFPKKIDEATGIVLMKDGYAIKFNPKSEGNASIKSINEKSSKLKIKKNSVNESDITYSDTEEEVEYKYSSYQAGVKEEIILNDKPLGNSFEFNVKIPGMKLNMIPGSKRIQISDAETNELVAYIDEPNIKDKDGEIRYDEVSYEIDEKGEGDYILNIVVDENYLQSTERNYPVTIDPTVVWMDSYLPSVTISTFTGHQNYNWKNDKYFQDQNKAIHTTPYQNTQYMCYIDTTNGPLSGDMEQFYGSRIEKATLKIVEYSINPAGYNSGTIEVRTPNGSWNPNTVTSNNCPWVGDKVWAQFQVSSTSDTGHYVDLKDWAQAIANREINNYGLALKAKEVGTGSYFYGASLQNLNYMQLSIVYKETHAGIKDIYEYESFKTPNGNGYIDKAQGNFIYTQDDMALPTPQLSMGISRVYNSNSNIVTGFGYGWSSNYDICLIPSNGANYIKIK